MNGLGPSAARPTPGIGVLPEPSDDPSAFWASVGAPDRRRVSVMILAAAFCGPVVAAGTRGGNRCARTNAAETALRTLEIESGGRLGVMAREGSNGAALSHRPHERFPMCSVYKAITAAAVLARIEAGELDAHDRVPLAERDLLDYAPVARERVADGFMTVEALCKAAVRRSDNTAANLLTDLIGGPMGWTRYVRSLGDGVSRLDRREPELNTALPDDARDTTTPAAMAGLMSRILVGTALHPGSRARLRGWMSDGDLTRDLFQAAVPAGWRVMDKSGSGDHGTRNDAGLLLGGGRPPIALCVFLTGAAGSTSERDALISRASGIAIEALG